MPELQAVSLVIQLPHRRHRFGVELIGTVGPGGVSGEFGGREIVQIRTHHKDRTLLIGHVGHSFEPIWRELWQHFRCQQTAIQGKPLGNRLGRAAFLIFVSCAYILHTSFTTLIKLE